MTARSEKRKQNEENEEDSHKKGEGRRQQQTNSVTMATDPLIVGFPHQRKSRRSLQFAETSQLYIYERRIRDPDQLWYRKQDYSMMRLAASQDVLKVRAARTAKEALDDDVTLMGIEHLLTPACIKEVKACRFRCKRAVLAEQAMARHAQPTGAGWETIALASVEETRKAVLRARKFGKLHQDSSRRS